MTNPSIYVASLSDYNAGTLHGLWIDVVGKDADEIQAEVDAMLARSPEFAAFPQGGPAEEWAIHDFEGFGAWRLSEWEQFTTVAAFGQAWDRLEADDAVVAFGDWFARGLTEKRGCVVDYLDAPRELVEHFEAEYRGNFTSWKDYVTESDLGIMYLGIDHLEHHFTGREYNGLTDRENAANAEMFQRLVSYIDWDMLARDLEIEDCEHHTTKAPAPIYGIFVFRDDE